MSLSKALGRNVEKVFSPMRHTNSFPLSSAHFKPVTPLSQSEVTEETEEDHLQYIQEKGYAHYLPICYGGKKGNVDGRRNIYLQSEDAFNCGTRDTMVVSRAKAPSGHWSSPPPCVGDIVVPYIPTQEKEIMNTNVRRGVPMIGKVVEVVDYHHEQENNTDHWNNIRGCEWLVERVTRQRSDDGDEWTELGIVVKPLVYSGFRNPIIVKDENGENVKWAPRSPSTNSLSPLHLTGLYKEMKESV